MLSSYVESLPRMNADELDTIQLRRILSEVDFRLVILTLDTKCFKLDKLSAMRAK